MIISNNRITFYLKCLLLILIIYTIIEKLMVYAKFGALYTDEDQCILWLAADELIHGHFREPCFFGQAYNSCLEGWLSIPFLISGLDYYQAIPLTTLLMSVIPFFLLLIYYFKKKEIFTTIAILFILLIFSLDYKLISVLPRGFITGVFCFGIGYYFLLKDKKYAILLFSFFASFGFAFNEMSVFLILPIFLIYIKDNYKSKKFYFQGILGLLPALIYKSYAYYFYNISNQNYNYFIKPKFNWSLYYLKNAFSHLDDWFFNDFFIVAIFFLILFTILFYKKQHYLLFVFFLTFLGVIAIVGLERAQEGVISIMFSKSRLFIFIPFLFAILFSRTIPLLNLNLKQQFYTSSILMVILIVNCTLQQISFDDKIKKEINDPKKIVTFLSISDVYSISYKYIAICHATKNNLVLYDCAKKIDNLLYLTIPLLSKNEIKTVLPYYDRRLWIYNDILKSRPNKVLVSGNFEDRYSRETLKYYKRKIIEKEDYWLVEYNLTKDIENTCLEDFILPLRKH